MRATYVIYVWKVFSMLQPGVTQTEIVFVFQSLDVKNSMNYIILKLDWKLRCLELVENALS